MTQAQIRQMRKALEEHPEDALTEPQAAAILQMSTSALRNRRYRKTAPPWVNMSDDGGSIRYLRTSILEWLKSNEIESETPAMKAAKAKLHRARDSYRHASAALDEAYERTVEAIDEAIEALTVEG